MKQISMVCPHCGAPLNTDASAKQVVCEYCGTTSFLVSETKQLEYKNSEQAGYEFEKGRLRAQAEQAQQPIVQQVVYEYIPTKPKKRHTFWWVMGWIFIFPIPATILIVRNKKMHWLLKAFLVLAVWVLYAVILSGGSNS